jgi:parallel beta-helix repeat protein
MRAANHIRTGTLALATCAIFAAVSSALAVDGEVLINQAKVNAGGITPGDTAGFPAKLSRPGRYKLSGNLTVPALTNGIEVTAGDVTIDLNGFTIINTTAGQAASGIVGVLPAGGVLRVINGTVTGFSESGVSKASGRGVVEDMRILSNGRNLELPGDSQVRNSTIANGNSPMIAPGIRCYARCLIEQNTVTGNNGAGVALEAGGGTVLGNVIVGNGFAAISSSDTRTGYGNNVLLGNGAGGQVSGIVSQLHPNVCDPACP